MYPNMIRCIRYTEFLTYFNLRIIVTMDENIHYIYRPINFPISQSHIYSRAAVYCDYGIYTATRVWFLEDHIDSSRIHKHVAHCEFALHMVYRRIVIEATLYVILMYRYVCDYLPVYTFQVLVTTSIGLLRRKTKIGLRQ